MADVPWIEYEHDAAEAHIQFFNCTNGTVTWVFPGKEVNRQPASAAGVGKVIDLNKTYRIFSGTSILTKAVLIELHTQVQPAAAPTYTGVYPRLTAISGTTWTNVEVVCTGLSATIISDDRWSVKFEFTEKST
ncbi:unnamed protein product [marine sediment metagenome]|uniref:Uncharacterized protein n=1 Tax=marine sediment metagenome TaxID=412755 RepID=X0T899_9ZZZZ